MKLPIIVPIPQLKNSHLLRGGTVIPLPFSIPASRAKFGDNPANNTKLIIKISNTHKHGSSEVVNMLKSVSKEKVMGANTLVGQLFEKIQ